MPCLTSTSLQYRRKPDTLLLQAKRWERRSVRFLQSRDSGRWSVCCQTSDSGSEACTSTNNLQVVKGGVASDYGSEGQAVIPIDTVRGPGGRPLSYETAAKILRNTSFHYHQIGCFLRPYFCPPACWYFT